MLKSSVFEDPESAVERFALVGCCEHFLSCDGCLAEIGDCLDMTAQAVEAECLRVLKLMRN